MNTGPMRKRLTLQQLVETQDSTGEAVKTWNTLGTYWGMVRSPTGKEALNAQQQKATVTHIVQMRYIASNLPSGILPPTWRFLLGNRVLSLVSVVDVDERHREYHIMCEEIVAPTTTP
jgi:SPP1 family predicted phage head-tail adaptor